MNRSCSIGPVALMLLVMTACAPGPLEERWPEARPLADDLPTWHPPQHPDRPAAESTSPFVEPQGTVTLRDALAAALLNNPQLASFSWDVRIAEAQALQARMWPNPEVAVEVENFAGSGDTRDFDGAETTVLLSQLIPLGGKIARQSRVADLNRDLAGWDYEAARIATLTTVAQAVVDVEASQRRVELARQNLDLAEQVHSAVDKKVNAGAAPALERTRAAVALETSRIAGGRAQRDLAAARHRLAATWGGKEPRFERVDADLDAIHAIPEYAWVTARIARNPDWARWAAEVRQRQAAFDLAKAQSVPDVTAGAGVRRFEETQDTAAVVELSIPLPVFDRNQGGVLEARYAVAKARADQRDAEVRLTNDLAQAYQSLAGAYHEGVALRDTVLPAARDAFDATNNAYRQGQRGYLEVLDAQRELFAVHDQYIQSLVAYHRAIAEVEGLIGEALPNAVEANDTAIDTPKDNPNADRGDQP